MLKYHISLIENATLLYKIILAEEDFNSSNGLPNDEYPYYGSVPTPTIKPNDMEGDLPKYGLSNLEKGKKMVSLGGIETGQKSVIDEGSGGGGTIGNPNSSTETQIAQKDAANLKAIKDQKAENVTRNMAFFGNTPDLKLAKIAAQTEKKEVTSNGNADIAAAKATDKVNQGNPTPTAPSQTTATATQPTTQPTTQSTSRPLGGKFNNSATSQYA